MNHSQLAATPRASLSLQAATAQPIISLGTLLAEDREIPAPRFSSQPTHPKYQLPGRGSKGEANQHCLELRRWVRTTQGIAER